MHPIPDLRWSVRAASAGAIGLLLAIMPLQRAGAVDLLGLYLGAAAGQSRVEADGSGFTPGDFRKNHSAFKVMAGAHPIATVGAELAYLDMGHPSGSLGARPADVTMKGEAAFATLFLPIPVVDVYGKLGFARLESTVNSTQLLAGVGTCTVNSPTCALRPFRLDRTNTRFAAGAGVQYRLGSWALRGEYERFDAAGGTPSLISLGLAWTFL
ncbi:MAG TPA: outer membrane beta-barrel protein [Burkholderiaceae bacterium]|jgi:opacity protein-like surface antigen|nr:outer membrane beta-barrel protein [Burkholderiaceae bacterium]